MGNFGVVFLRLILVGTGALIIIKTGRLAVKKIMASVEKKELLREERLKQTQTISRILSNIISVSVGIIAGIIMLEQLGFDIGPILAGAGIVGIALGLGAQSLVKDLINGIFILMENQFNVGDVIRVAGVAGLVESMSLRVVTLRDLEGRVHIIPNGAITVVTNMTKEWSRCLLNVGVAYKENVDYVMEVLKEIGDELYKDKEFKKLINSPLEILGVNDFGNSQVSIKVMFNTKPLKQWTVAREFRRRIKNTFDAKGIEIPFPHLTLYMGEGDNKGKLVVEQVPT